MELYLIRHGESESNFDGTHSGWSPVNLTEKGRRQALAARSLVESTAFDTIYVSDVRRAQQTARIVFPEKPFVFCSLIRELNNTAMRGKTKEDMMALFPDLYPACRRAFDYAPLGMDCESGAHLRARAGEFLSFLAAEEPVRAAAVCHAGFIKACAAWVLNTPTHVPPMHVDNASVCILAFRNGLWRVKSWNLTAALPE